METVASAAEPLIHPLLTKTSQPSKIRAQRQTQVKLRTRVARIRPAQRTVGLLPTEARATTPQVLTHLVMTAPAALDAPARRIATATAVTASTHPMARSARSLVLKTAHHRNLSVLLREAALIRRLFA